MPQVIDIDELATTPSPKRRKLIPIVPKASPSKLSDLLSVFGARKSYTSVSVMDRSPVGGHSLRGATTFSYAESPISSAQSTPRSASSFDSNNQDDTDVIEDDASEDELTSEDTIHGERCRRLSF